MSQIKCPKCGGFFSSSYNFCPNCGYDVRELQKDPKMLISMSKQLVRDGYYYDGIEMLKQACSMGDGEAMYIYGEYFFYGRYNININYDKCLYCMNKAIGKRYEPAKVFLIKHYCTGELRDKLNKEELIPFALNMSSSYLNSLAPNIYDLLFEDAMSYDEFISDKYLNTSFIFTTKKERERKAEQLQAYLNEISKNKKRDEEFTSQKPINPKAVEKPEKVKKDDEIVKEKEVIKEISDDYFESKPAGKLHNLYKDTQLVQYQFKENTISLENENQDKRVVYNEANKKQAYQDECNFYKKISAKLQNVRDKLVSGKQALEDVDSYDEDARYEEALKRSKNVKIWSTVKDNDYIFMNPYHGHFKVQYDNSQTEDFCVGSNTIFGEYGQIIVYKSMSYIDDIYQSHETEFQIDGRHAKLLLKREVYFHNGKVDIVTELFNINKASYHLDIISDEYLLKVLSQQRGEGEVHNIISSIQYHQHQISISDFDKDLIMQGCAGCGKTMVMFHRISYGLTRKHFTNNDISIIVPNTGFINFIKPLISSLNLSEKNMYTPEMFYANILDRYVLTSKNLNYAIPGTIGYTKTLKFTKLFDEKCSKEENHLPLVIRPDDELPEEVVSYYYSNEFITKLYKLKKFAVKPLSPSKMKNAIDKESKLDLMKALFTKDILQILPAYDRVSGVIHRCELYAIVQIYLRRCGHFKYQEKQKFTEYVNLDFKNVFIDEAQGFSPNEIHLIKSLSRHECYINLFGDTQQCLAKYAINDWSSVSKYLDNPNYFTYNRNYRNTFEIIEYVNQKCNMKMQNIGLNGEDIDYASLLTLRNKIANDKNKRKAIICIQEYKGLFSDYPITACTPQEARGIEFDSVYVLTKSMNDNEKYISFTRPLKKLTIVH